MWRLLDRLLAGGSIKAAVEALSLPFALETLYHLLHRLRGLVKVRLEVLWAALTYNIQQWIRLSWQPGLAAANN